MGDRVLFQVVSGNNVSPVVYCHWAGSDAPRIVRALAERMTARGDDVDYAAARLVQECTALDPDGFLGFGISNASARLTKADSHGDAGVVLIDCADNFRCECLGGYLVTGPDGFPKEKRNALYR